MNTTLRAILSIALLSSLVGCDDTSPRVASDTAVTEQLTSNRCLCASPVTFSSR